MEEEEKWESDKKKSDESLTPEMRAEIKKYQEEKAKIKRRIFLKYYPEYLQKNIIKSNVGRRYIKANLDQFDPHHRDLVQPVIEGNKSMFVYGNVGSGTR